jgi:CBS domain-containing protein
MKVSDVMTSTVATVHLEASYKDVVEAMVAAGVSGLPVVDHRGSPVGIVTEADVIAKEAYPGRRRRALALLADMLSVRDHHWVTKATGWTVADVMTKQVATCGPHDDVHAVARRMLTLGIKRMLVVDDRTLVGIVSRHDILRGLVRPDTEIAADVTRILHTHPNRPDDHHVNCSVEGGRVVLTGDVRYAWDEPIVLDLVRRVDGVIDVVSRLHHREPTPLVKPPWYVGMH